MGGSRSQVGSKPFGISKIEVWRAWEQVKVNQGWPVSTGSSWRSSRTGYRNNLYKGARFAPSPETIRRVLLALASPDTLHVVAVDGKTLRGSATPTEASVHLLASLTPERITTWRPPSRD